MAHTIPIRHDPKFALEILYEITSCPIVARCQRGEAVNFANLLIDFLDEAV